MRRNRYGAAWVERVVAIRGDVSRQPFNTDDTDRGSLGLAECMALVAIVALLYLVLR